MDNFYRQQLYPLQNRVIKVINNVESGFYLTGGTAASRGYLQHRYSDDLDFFVNDDDQFELWGERIINALDAEEVWQIEVLLRQPRYIRLNVTQGQVFLKLEFINDVPAHVGEIIMHPVLGRLDSAENILANKITALLAREEPKDLADIWGNLTYRCKKPFLERKARLRGFFRLTWQEFCYRRQKPIGKSSAGQIRLNPVLTCVKSTS